MELAVPFFSPTAFFNDSAFTYNLSAFTYNVTTTAQLPGKAVTTPVPNEHDIEAMHFAFVEKDEGIGDYFELSEQNATSNGSLVDVLSKTHRKSNVIIPVDVAIGIIVAVVANSLVGISIILKKQSLKQLRERGAVRPSEGGFGYLKAYRWWLGLFILSLGEGLNFVAYIFAPAILVTPLGVFSIVVVTVLSPYFLQETLSIIGKLGCFLVIIGCFIVTLCGPKDQEMSSMEELEYYLLSPGFLIYCTIVVIIATTLMFFSGKYGSKYIMLNVLIVTTFASITVILTKGIGVTIKTTVEQGNAFNRWPFWVCFFIIIFALAIEIIYSQKSLDLFNSSIVMSISYVMFAGLVMLVSIVIFSENRHIYWKDGLLTLTGFIINIVALYMMNYDRETEIFAEKPEDSNSQEQLAESPPPLDTLASEKESEEQNLCEIRRDSKSDSFSTPLSHTPKVTPVKCLSISSCTLANVGSVMFRDSIESNNCLSLISETLSSKINDKDRHSLEGSTDNNSNESSPRSAHLKKLECATRESQYSTRSSYRSQRVPKCKTCIDDSASLRAVKSNRCLESLSDLNGGITCNNGRMRLTVPQGDVSSPSMMMRVRPQYDNENSDNVDNYIGSDSMCERRSTPQTNILSAVPVTVAHGALSDQFISAN